MVFFTMWECMQADRPFSSARVSQNRLRVIVYQKIDATYSGMRAAQAIGLFEIQTGLLSRLAQILVYANILVTEGILPKFSVGRIIAAALGLLQEHQIIFLLDKYLSKSVSV